MKNNICNLIFCSLGIFVSYFIYGILQENITKAKYGNDSFDFYVSMLGVQCVINCIFAYVGKLVSRSKLQRIPISNSWALSFCYIAAMFASNYSLKYVNYPTQIVGKSIKPIPVLIFSVLWGGKRYPLKKYLFVLLITMGVILFLYKDGGQSKPGFHFGLGELLLLVSLILDGFTGGMQQDLLSRYKVDSFNLMFDMNLWSTLYLLMASTINGEFSLFAQFIENHPIVLYNIGLFGITSAIGQLFIFTMIANFGPLMCSIVTTTRKFFAVLASIILFKHVLSQLQWFGTMLVFSGLICDQIWGKATHAQAANSKKSKAN